MSIDTALLEDFARRHGIRCLSLFGSALRDDTPAVQYRAPTCPVRPGITSADLLCALRRAGGPRAVNPVPT